MLLKRSFDDESDEGSACASDDEESHVEFGEHGVVQNRTLPTTGTIITDIEVLHHAYRPRGPSG